MSNLINSLLVNREVGELGLSIATDLAISRALGKHPEIVDASPPINDYNMLLINLRTLARNIYGSLGTEVRKSVGTTIPAEKLLDEIAVITELIGSSKVAIYYCTYDGLAKQFGESHVRRLSTEKQIVDAKMEEECCVNAFKILKARGEAPGFFDVDIKNATGITKPLIVTHLPVDLLSAHHFTGMTLLESHTGAIKPRLQWNTKLGKHKGEKVLMMPFNEFTLKVFGDNGNLLVGKDGKVRDALIEVAKKFKWTPTVTNDRIRWTISNIANVGYRDELAALL